MSFGWALASILILLTACGIVAVCLCLAGRCDHTLYPKIHVGSGRIFYVCRCGLRFDASSSSSDGPPPGSLPSSPGPPSSHSSMRW